jgi:hypothetical protein
MYVCFYTNVTILYELEKLKYLHLGTPRDNNLET